MKNSSAPSKRAKRILTRPNPTQWSLLVPTFLAFFAGSLFGAFGFLSAVVAVFAAPAIFIVFSKKKERPLWKKAGITSALAGVGMLTSFLASGIGYETVFRAQNPSVYKAEMAKLASEGREATLKRNEALDISNKPIQRDGLSNKQYVVCEESGGSYVG
ncbi:hypothetical protein KBY72_13965, partial [Cyanobium sp. BA5m-21]|uniref:hypothetical protein n=1 Tax=Cyanobium sp. BA5m-21 TaxID=2823706 RepID=UPI0020CD1E86